MDMSKLNVAPDIRIPPFLYPCLIQEPVPGPFVKCFLSARSHIHYLYAPVVLNRCLDGQVQFVSQM